MSAVLVTPYVVLLSPFLCGNDGTTICLLQPQLVSIRIEPDAHLSRTNTTWHLRVHPNLHVIHQPVNVYYHQIY